MTKTPSEDVKLTPDEEHLLSTLGASELAKLISTLPEEEQTIQQARLDAYLSQQKQNHSEGSSSTEQLPTNKREIAEEILFWQQVERLANINVRAISGETISIREQNLRRATTEKLKLRLADDVEGDEETLSLASGQLKDEYVRECIHHRRVANEKLQVEVAAKKRELLPREEVRIMLGKVAQLYRQAGETISREFGDVAARIINDTLDDVANLTDQYDRRNAEGNGSE